MEIFSIAIGIWMLSRWQNSYVTAIYAADYTCEKFSLQQRICIKNI